MQNFNRWKNLLFDTIKDSNIGKKCKKRSDDCYTKIIGSEFIIITNSDDKFKEFYDDHLFSTLSKTLLSAYWCKKFRTSSVDDSKIFDLVVAFMGSVNEGKAARYTIFTVEGVICGHVKHPIFGGRKTNFCYSKYEDLEIDDNIVDNNYHINLGSHDDYNDDIVGTMELSGDYFWDLKSLLSDVANLYSSNKSIYRNCINELI